MALLASNTAALGTAMKSTVERLNDVEDGPAGLRGKLRGLSEYDAWRRHFIAHPGAYATSMRRAVHAAADGVRAPTDLRADSVVEHLYDRVPVGQHRTIGYFLFGLAMAADFNRLGQHAEADDMIARLLAFGEQVILDSGNLDHGWLLTFLPQPQWTRFPRPPQASGGKGKKKGGPEPTFPTLVDPKLVTAAMGYVTDLASHAEARRKLKGTDGVQADP
jgi:hypothetical protein